LYEGSNDDSIRTRMTEREPELVRLLSSPSIESLRAADRLVRELREGISDVELVAALRRGEARIDCEPRTFQPFQLIRLSLRFDRDELNGTAAQSRFRCEWEFPTPTGANGTTPQTEQGWSICHYLSGAEPATINADVYRVTHPAENHLAAGANSGSGAGDEKPTPVKTLEETITPLVESEHNRSHRMKAELIGLGVVLLIALLGLITGAREQITKLDIVPGMIAVFLLGFSADSIKGLLTPRPQTEVKTS
jgi:hypothetical protein